MKTKIIEKVIELIFRPRWVNCNNDFGIKLRFFPTMIYYKWSDPCYIFPEDEDKNSTTREAFKREFGECVHPIDGVK